MSNSLGAYLKHAIAQVRWPGAYVPLDFGSPLGQGDILTTVPFIKFPVNPDNLDEVVSRLSPAEFEVLPSVILNHDCDTVRDPHLQLLPIRTGSNIERLYPKAAANASKKRDRFREYCKNVRTTRLDDIHKYWLPPGPKGFPFDTYHYADLRAVSTLDIMGSRQWAEKNRVARLSREVLADLLAAMNFRYTRVGRNDYFRLGPVDAIAKYIIELQDEITEERYEKASHSGHPGIEEDHEHTIKRLEAERLRLGVVIKEHADKQSFLIFYENFIEAHPDKKDREFVSTYLTPLNELWTAIWKDTPPWETASPS
ncbi:MAG: hypothetical protein M1598_07905 [Actinobacteria bacterium]|nr:hypothetical protein [Actinomycetota bacterium]